MYDTCSDAWTALIQGSLRQLDRKTADRVAVLDGDHRPDPVQRPARSGPLPGAGSIDPPGYSPTKNAPRMVGLPEQNRDRQVRMQVKEPAAA